MPRFSTLTQVQDAIQSGATTLVEVVDHYLEKIHEYQALNIYVEVFAEEALEKAHQLEQKYRENPAQVGRLFGAVVSIKDVICYQGHTVTAGSKILEGFQSLFSATAVERLLAEDAIIIGRTNCDEFAMGSTNETSYYGPVRNAADPTKVPGGSSGGAAVAVQADTCLISLGTDTGGSVRQPAALCGVIGMKPSYGRISRHGLLAYGSSFDQVGILGHSVQDIALTLEIVAGKDDFDATTTQGLVPPYSQMLEFKGPVKVAYFDTAVNHPSLDPGIRAHCLRMIEWLKAQGHTVESVPFDYLDYIIPAYYVLTTAEASSNLSRYDGIRFGYRSPNTQTLEETYKKSRTEGFGREVKRRIMLGAFVLSSGYYDAYYTKAQKVRRLISDQTNAIFAEYDFLLMPAAPTPAWGLGESLEDPVAMYLADIFTVQANMVGIPGIALPVGTHETGLPVGLQFMAGKLKEAELLAFAQQISSNYPQ
ncbi:Asp-tRNA(Asn)/Glu-tRNA(Gln) amidotransferase subunit GatA [Haliscomenobacter hydrossis]|uniref:Glutamyl-tRNA(Gln) amidotransferase subunit A n=1 Tax=Haliscomenobacter hydrossis (strain ATCC 27775 / DSM 1100 / LMG 10767 / O) TaxID=760192 RepID=F4KTA1_HALH1|nr:Asp-tRNA(Asn)/Glu-tRNA(Gln) amidotransferase subunit GatA [Haliscomenobacter hydrossis]AEE51158.1 Glutamyl-tRNA(Gln) amidotransferase subunit A [Haliscomenobacter hydrossis DSM 1100]